MLDSSISLMSRAGDEIIVTWDHADPKTHKRAVRAFKKLRRQGAMIHTIERQESTALVRGQQLFEEDFDPGKSQRLIARPAFQGG